MLFEATMDEDLRSQPAELAVRLALQHVPQQDRLTCAARVCRAWHAVAASGISSISVSRLKAPQCAALTAWLHHYGPTAAVSRLELCNCDPLVLPCKVLSGLWSFSACNTAIMGEEEATAGPEDQRQLQQQQWQLGSSQLQGPLAPAAACFLPQLTGLTRLAIIGECNTQLDALSALTGLHDLSLRIGSGGYLHHTYDTQLRYSMQQAAEQALPHLVHLTALDLHGLSRAMPFKACISGLHHLRRLDTECCDLDFSSATAMLVGLTHLVMHPDTFAYFSPRDTPGLCQMTNLRELEIFGSRTGVEPAVLCNLKQLQRLTIESTFYGTEDQPSPAVLSNLTRLSHLMIGTCDMMPGRLPNTVVAPDVCPALTASTHLTYLGLAGQQLPVGGTVRMFATGRQYPNLVEIMGTPSVIASAADVEQLTSCCPAIERLRIDYGAVHLSTQDKHDWSVDRIVSLEGLSRLSALTKLVLKGPDVKDAAHWTALAQLTDLRDLRVKPYDFHGEFRFSLVKQLTGLTRLTTLEVDVGMSWCFVGIRLHNQAPDGMPSDVVSRLPDAIAAAQAELSEYSSSDYDEDEDETEWETDDEWETGDE